MLGLDPTYRVDPTPVMASTSVPAAPAGLSTSPETTRCPGFDWVQSPQSCATHDLTLWAGFQPPTICRATPWPTGKRKEMNKPDLIIAADWSTRAQGRRQARRLDGG